MKWIDTVEDTIAKYADRSPPLRVVTRAEYIADVTGPVAIRGVAFRGDGDARWIRVALSDVHDPKATWIVWDFRDERRPVPFMVGVTDLRAAILLGEVAAASKVARMTLAAVTTLGAAAVAMREAWGREGQRKA